MKRTQYITISELNEILGVNTYTDNDLVKLYEASETIEYYLFNAPQWDTANTPKNIKLATAYQFDYMNRNNLFIEWEEGDFTLGKFSIKSGSGSTKKPTVIKVSSKAKKYLVMSGYVNRLV